MRRRGTYALLAGSLSTALSAQPRGARFYHEVIDNRRADAAIRSAIHAVQRMWGSGHADPPATRSAITQPRRAQATKDVLVRDGALVEQLLVPGQFASRYRHPTGAPTISV